VQHPAAGPPELSRGRTAHDARFYGAGPRGSAPELVSVRLSPAQRPIR
jgi:hypothetical protein